MNLTIDKPKCARCHRPFTPKHEGDRYGPTCARKMDAMQTQGQLFIAPDGVMIKNEGGNLCRGCGTDLSDEPDREYCSECEDDPNVQAVTAYRRAVIV